MRRRIAEPGVVARIGRRFAGAERDLEIRIVRHPAIGLGMTILPIGQIARILLADKGVERVIDLLLIARPLRQLQLAPHRTHQLVLGARVHGGVGVGVQQAAMGYADPNIATRAQPVKPQIAGLFLKIDIALRRAREGIDQARHRRGRIDHQRRGRAVADAAPLGGQGDDPPRNQPLPAARNRDATGRNQRDIALRIGLHEVDRDIARKLPDGDVTHRGGRAQAARPARTGRRHFQLDGHPCRANSGAGREHHVGA